MANKPGRIVSYPKAFLAIKSHSTARPPVKPIHLHYHHTYGHETWQGGDFP